MKYQEQRDAFRKLLVQQGICRLDQLHEALPFGYSIPQHLVNKWLDRILSLPKDFSLQRRYVNRFKLGADPEFFFVDNGEPVYAKHMGLAQGLAYGMDNNGRLVEIRPHPSRSALHVVASILLTLRWLAILCPKALDYEWVCGAFMFGDGLGGHVHFGRKRPGRNLEVKALDMIEDELLALKAYPVEEVHRRRLGDEHHQVYGMPGDIRKQLHGYEYRTFPSWLDSPELAFLTITLSKLAVYNPALLQGCAPFRQREQHYQRIFNLLSFYKDMDDDARLALRIVARALPTHIGKDFRKRWGLPSAPIVGEKLPVITCVPSSVKADASTVQELFKHFLGEQPLTFKIPVPTWSPLTPLEGYIPTITAVNTYQAKGLGELVWDVCHHKSLVYMLVNNREMRKDVFFQIPIKLANTLPLGWKKFCGGKIIVHTGESNVIYCGEKAREGANFNECRRLLLETVLPFWRLSQVKPDSAQQWRNTLRHTQKVQDNRYAGKLEYGASAALPLRELR